MRAGRVLSSGAESKEKHGVWDPVLNLTITSLYVDSRVLQHMYHVQTYARVDVNLMTESTLSPSQGLRIWPLGLIAASSDTVKSEGRQMKQ
jgi:hypothetical protein